MTQALYAHMNNKKIKIKKIFIQKDKRLRRINTTVREKSKIGRLT
jgi:hypothetical protein